MEPEMTSDCPFRGVVWQHPVRKQHQGYRNRPFQPPIGNLMPLSGQEMTTFSNDTGPFSRIHRLMVERGLLGTRDQKRSIPEMHSTEAILTSDCPFRGVIWQHPVRKQHHGFRNRPFQPLINIKAPDSGPEMTTFCNDTGQFPGNKVPGDDPEAGMHGTSWQWSGRSPVESKATGGWPGTMAWPAAGNFRRDAQEENSQSWQEMNPL
jgi:hypothetical protein